MGISTRRTIRPSPKDIKRDDKQNERINQTPKKASKPIESISKSEKIIENFNDLLLEFHNTNGEFDHFFVTNDKQCQRYKNILKHLYDHLQSKYDYFDSKIQPKLRNIETVKCLMVKEFDNEQIWQQLKMFNEPFLKNVASDVAFFSKKKTLVTFNIDMEDSKQKGKTSEKESSKRNTKFAFDDDFDGIEEPLGDEAKKLTIPKQLAKMEQKQKQSNQKVDFFDLKEMEAFLDAEDKKVMDDEAKQDIEEEDIDIDYFADIPSDEEQYDMDNDQNAVMYSDFFDPPFKKVSKSVTFHEGGQQENQEEDEDEDEQNDDKEIEGLDTRDFDEEDMFEGGYNSDDDNEEEEEYENEEEEDDEEDENEREIENDSLKVNSNNIFEASSSDDEENDNINQRLRNLAAQNFGEDSEDDLEGKSEFEKSQILLKRRIEKAQRELLQPVALNWKLAGEAVSDSRPENSLLEEHLDFDHISRPAPVITDDTTKTLESLIRQRIKDKAFDDVERKNKPKEQPFEFRRRLMIESEKSKVSLAEVYEKEFVKKQQEGQQEKQVSGFVAAGEAEESENRVQIRRMMKSLFRKLDALSGFHFTPRAPEVDVKIISNLPAVSIEESTPDMVSGKSLMAPEEIFNTRNKKTLQAPSERNTNDRKRARRIKKKKQGIRQRLDMKKHGVSVSITNKAEIEKLKTAKALSNGLKKTFTSSGKFFERLQETKDIAQNEKRKRKPVAENLAKKLKLN